MNLVGSILFKFAFLFPIDPDHRTDFLWDSVTQKYLIFAWAQLRNGASRRFRGRRCKFAIMGNILIYNMISDQN
jgi:hypothetical protein